MTIYQGVIIKESLQDTAVLSRVKICATDVEPVTGHHQTPWLAQWTLHTVEVPADQAQQIAEEISRALDPTHAGSWYADFRNDSHHFIIFHNRVFCIDRKCPEPYGPARRYARDLGIPEHQVDFPTP